MNVRLTTAVTGRVGEDYPWFSAPIFGIFSATAAAGKMLGLTVPRMINAFGIALDRAAGITESFNSPDSEIRAVRDAYGNREGVLAAIMAQKGLEACKNPFDILYKVYYNNEVDPAPIVADLGEDFSVRKVGFKAWPCCRVAHTYVKAALEIFAEHPVRPEDIEEILLTVGKFGRDFLFTPLEIKQRPKSGIQAKLSLPFVMGVVFSRGRVTIEDFLEENLSDPQVLRIAERTRFTFDPALCNDAIGAGIVEVRMKDGPSMVKREDIPYGNPANPISDDELKAKFRECARYAPTPLDEGKVEHIIKKVLELEKVENIKEIAGLLS
jgi:2-methylcitrate dehydratase PrpD